MPAEARSSDGTGRLAENVAWFGRALRAAGLSVGPGAVVEGVEALLAARQLSREDFYWTLHAVFVKRREDSAVFDQAFRVFFRRRSLVEKMIAMLSPVAPGFEKEFQPPEAGAQRVADAFAGESFREREEATEITELDARLTVSDRELLKTRDFAQMTAAELAVARRLIARLQLPANTVPTRRFVPDARGRRVDARRSFRRSLQTGGAMLDLAFRDRAERHPPIVALVDISGSMAEYSRVLLHFLHGLAERRGRVHSFVFGTRLTNVTQLMRAKDPDEALALCGRAAPDWEGGTRIATTLHAFNRHWSRRVLGGGAVVLLFTDGLERSAASLDDADLAFEMDRLHRSCRRLVWLNPLLRFEAFEARAGGIRAMLPHVDEFRPIHNLSSMEALCRALAGTADSGRSLAARPDAWLKSVA